MLNKQKMNNFQTFQDENSEILKKKSNLKRRIIAVFVSGLVVILSFVLGYAVRRASSKCYIAEESAALKRLSQADRDKFYQEIVSSIDHLKIQENLRFFAGKPHVATSERNNLLGEEVYKRFVSSGFKAEKLSYNVYLSFPSSEKENVVSVLDLNGMPLYKTNVSNENFTGIIPPYNAFSPKGIVEGEPVYVNYGRRDDFEKLKDLGISCSGKVVIVRYGKISRGSKVGLAEKCGAIGVVIYSDPEESGPVNDDELFPKSKWLPRSSVQRGSIKISYGDPLTDGYPSKDWVYRLEPENADLPKLPTQPISAYDAFNIMKEMDGVAVPEDWKGMLNVAYRLTGKKKVKIEVYNENVIRTVTNIVGTVEGNVEPDRYVMLGNHRDAWVHGAVDSSSGTSIMMEMARVIGEKLKKGWLPRRTIKLISWDGEEHDLVGSNEFVEEFLHELRNRGVVYLNLDPAIFGNESLLAIGSGLLRDVIWNSSKLVAYPDKEQTVYDKMVHFNPDEKKKQPKFEGLTSASDYAPFYCLAGVTSANFKFGKGETYSTYHTEYDTVEWMESYGDPGYRAHLAYSQVLMHILLRVSDSSLIPFNAVALSEDLKDKCAKVVSDIHQKDAAFDAGHLFGAVNKFEAASTKLKRLLEKEIDIDKPNSELLVRMLNDVIMQIEKVFLRDSGLPGREIIKNYIAAPAASDAYSSSLFPSIVDSLDKVKVNSAANQAKEWNAVKKEVTLVALTIEASAHWIERGVQLLSLTGLKVK